MIYTSPNARYLRLIALLFKPLLRLFRPLPSVRLSLKNKEDGLSCSCDIPADSLFTLHLTREAKVNQMQRAAARWVKGLRGLTYEEPLQALKLQPLGKEG